jgi:hypothetical protein
VTSHASPFTHGGPHDVLTRAPSRSTQAHHAACERRSRAPANSVSELVRGRDLHEHLNIALWGSVCATREPVTERHWSITTEQRVDRSSITAAVQIDKRLRPRTDQLQQGLSIRNVDHRMIEAVGAVARMAQTDRLHDFVRTPVR